MNPKDDHKHYFDLKFQYLQENVFFCKTHKNIKCWNLKLWDQLASYVRMSIRPEILLKHSLLKNERVLASEHVKIGQDPLILIFLTTSLVLLLFLMQNWPNYQTFRPFGSGRVCRIWILGSSWNHILSLLAKNRPGPSHFDFFDDVARFIAVSDAELAKLSDV